MNLDKATNFSKSILLIVIFALKINVIGIQGLGNTSQNKNYPDFGYPQIL